MSRFFKRSPGSTETPSPAEPSDPEGTGPTYTHELLLRPLPTSIPKQRPPLNAEQQQKYDELKAWLQSVHDLSVKRLGDKGTEGANGDAASSVSASSAIPQPATALEESYVAWEQRWLDDSQLYNRYLRAAKYDLANAKKRIIGTMEWRRSFKPDVIIPEEIRVEGETGKHIISGFDKEGRPILYLRPRYENTKPTPRQIKYLVWSLERAIDLLPPGQDTICVVTDYKGANNSNNPSISVALKCLNILQSHYVERLGRLIIMNTPWLLSAFVKAVYPFLDPITKEKVKFDPSLPDLIPAEQLDAVWEGGLYRFEFKEEIYWPSILDFCGIAPDGTRSHPTRARDKDAIVHDTNATPAAVDTDTAPERGPILRADSSHPGGPPDTFVDAPDGNTAESDVPTETSQPSTLATPRDTNGLNTPATTRVGSEAEGAKTGEVVGEVANEQVV